MSGPQLCIGKKTYDLGNLKYGEKKHLRLRFTKEWDNYINGLKKLALRPMPGLSRKHAKIWAKAERLLEWFGKISKEAEMAAAREAMEFIHGRGRTIDLRQYRGWKEFSKGKILIKSDGSSNPVAAEKNIWIYDEDDDGERLVFHARYHSHCMGNPGYKLLKYQKGNWEKLLDRIWVGYCEELKQDKRALASRHGTVSMMIFGK